MTAYMLVVIVSEFFRKNAPIRFDNYLSAAEASAVDRGHERGGFG
jgi:hypothetical protein